MSSSGSRADGRSSGGAHHHRDVFQMPRDYSSSSLAYGPDKDKPPRRDRDGGFPRRLSSAISVDGGGISSNRRRGDLGHSGRPTGLSSSNGWHEGSRSYMESSHGGGGSIYGAVPASPRFDYSSADGSPRELDGYRHSKPNSPLFSHSRMSSMSHSNFSGKSLLAREHSRSSDWDSSFKGDMDYRDKFWGRSDVIKRTGTSSYENAPLHKDFDGRRDHELYGVNGDFMSNNSYHSRSYQEWRHNERMPTPALPLRSHIASNGFLTDSVGRGQGYSEVLGSYTSGWHSPLSSPISGDGGRDEVNQSSPRKRPRLGWGQGLAKYEKKLSEGATDDTNVNKGKTNNCLRENQSKIVGDVDKHVGNESKNAGDIEKNSGNELKNTMDVDKNAENGLKNAADIDNNAENGLKNAADIDNNAENGLKNAANIDNNAENRLKNAIDVDMNEENGLKNAADVDKNAGNDQDMVSSKVTVDSIHGSELDRENLKPVKEQPNAMAIDVKIQKSENLKTVHDAQPSLYSSNSSETIVTQKENEINCGFSDAHQQDLSEQEDAQTKAKILQRLEKLELELDLTEKELAKIDFQPDIEGIGEIPTCDTQPNKQSTKQSNPIAEVLDSCEDQCIEKKSSSTSDQSQLQCLGAQGRDTAHVFFFQTGQQEVPTSIDVNVKEGNLTEKAVGGDLEKGLVRHTLQPAASFSKPSDTSSEVKENEGCLPHSKIENMIESSVNKFSDVGKEAGELWKYVYHENQEQAKFNAQEMANLVRLTLQPAASFSKPSDTSAEVKENEGCLPHSKIENMIESSVNKFSDVGKEAGELWKYVYHENQEQAKFNAQEMANLLTGGNNIQLMHKDKHELCKKEILESDDMTKQMMQEMILERKKGQKFREHVLALKFRVLRDSWKREQAGHCMLSDPIEFSRKQDSERRNSQLPPIFRPSHKQRIVSGNSREDSSEILVVQKLLSEGVGCHQRQNLKMPSQLLDDKQRISERFITKNALIEDPMAFENERKLINPWTAEEKKIFLEKFILYSKDFKKISTFLEHKTVADCIEFYYKTQKTEEFQRACDTGAAQEIKNKRAPYTTKYLVSTASTAVNCRRNISSLSIEKLPPTTASSCSDSGKGFQGSFGRSRNGSHFGSVDSSGYDGFSRNPDCSSGRAFDLVQSPNSTGGRVAEEFDSQWTDNERQLFLDALGMFGKDFKSISQHVGTKGEEQCRTFFSKTRKRLRLDQVLEVFQSNLQESIEQEAGGDNMEIDIITPKRDTYHEAPLQGSIALDGVNASNTAGDMLQSDHDAKIDSLYSENEYLTNDCATIGQRCKEIIMKDHNPVGPDSDNVVDDEMVAALAIKSIISMQDQDQDIAAPYQDSISKLTVMSESLNQLQDGRGNEKVQLSVKTEEKISETVDFGNAEIKQENLDEQHCSNTPEFKAEENGVDTDGDEQHSSTPASLSPIEDGINVSLVKPDVSDKPYPEERDFQEESLDSLPQETTDSKQAVTGSVNQVAPSSFGISSFATSNALQIKSKGNSNSGEVKPRREATSWTQEEKEMFIDVVRKHGRDWNLLQQKLPTKSLTQIKTYFQNSKAKLGLTSEGSNSRCTGNRKHKLEDIEYTNQYYHLAQHKATSISDESLFKADQIANGSVGPMLGIPSSDAYPIALLGKGKWPIEESSPYSGMQSLVGFQQMQSNGFTQQSVSSNGVFQIFPPSTLSVLTPSGFQQSQNISLQQPLSHSASSKPQLAVLHPAQQLACLQAHTSSLGNLQVHGVNPVKQQQKPSQVLSHSPTDYQTQGLQQLQNWILQQQALQNYPQGLPAGVFQQQQPSQNQIICQQHSQQQHSSQSHNTMQHALKQSLHYMQQQASIQSLNQLASVASMQLPSSQQKAASQNQLPSQQQQLLNQLYEEQQKQYHLQQSNQLSQQAHTVLGSLPEQVLLHLQQQSNLQSEKHLKLLRPAFPISTDNHTQHSQTTDTITEKECRQHEDQYSYKTVTLQRVVSQMGTNDNLDLCDSVEQKHTVTQKHELGHFPAKLSRPSTSENHQTRTGDVKLFGQILMSQSTCSVNADSSAAANASSNITTAPAGVDVLEPSEVAYTVTSGLSKMGSFPGQGNNVSWLGTSVGGLVSNNASFEGKQLSCIGKGVDLENDSRTGQVVAGSIGQHLGSENREKDIRGGSPPKTFDRVDQVKKVQNIQNNDWCLGIKLMDENSCLSFGAGNQNFSKVDLKSNTNCNSGNGDSSKSVCRVKRGDMGMGTDSDWQGSHEHQYYGGHDSVGIQHCKEPSNNSSCSKATSIKCSVVSDQIPIQTQSLGVGSENILRDKAFLVQQAMPHCSVNAGLSSWSAGGGCELGRVNLNAVSPVWTHSSMTIDGTPRIDPGPLEDAGEES